MKKLVIILITIICMTCFCVQSSASNLDQDTISVGNVDIVFDSNSSLTAEEKQIIADNIVTGNFNVQTYGLICNLFGHKTSTEIVTTITHKANSAVPRCLRENWEVLTCSRCDYVETNRLSFSFIDCCPVD